MSNEHEFLAQLSGLCKKHGVIVMPFTFYTRDGKRRLNLADTPTMPPNAVELSTSDEALAASARMRVEMIATEVSET